jgi:hypothetical protein
VSRLLKSVGKIFKSVVKVIKKVAPIALMVGAVVLSGGAAIGALPAVGSVLGGLGLSAGVTAALTSAVTTAAIGAGVGALGAAATGGNILKGATSGALVGAVGGGLMGAIAPAATASTAAAGDFVAPGLTGAAADTAAAWGGAAAAPLSVAPITGLAPIAAPAAAGGGGLLSTIGKTLGSPTVISGLINGVGQGISANEASKAQAKQAQANRDYISGNYATSGAGLLNNPGVAQPVSNNMLAPSDKFDPLVYGGQFRADPTTGKLVYIPRQPTQGV